MTALAIVLGGLLRLARGEYLGRRRPAPHAPSGAVTIAIRWCPGCIRREPALLHTDGAHTCLHCHITTIPGEIHA